MKEITTLPELKRVYTLARRAMVKRCAGEGKTQTEAAKELGVTRTVLHRIITAEKINWPVKRQGRTPGGTAANAIPVHVLGKDYTSLHAASCAENLHRNTIYHWIKEKPHKAWLIEKENANA